MLRLSSAPGTTSPPCRCLGVSLSELREAGLRQTGTAIRAAPLTSIGTQGVLLNPSKPQPRELLGIKYVLVFYCCVTNCHQLNTHLSFYSFCRPEIQAPNGWPFCSGYHGTEIKALTRTAVSTWPTGSSSKVTGYALSSLPQSCSTEYSFPCSTEYSFPCQLLAKNCSQPLAGACDSLPCGPHGKFPRGIFAFFHLSDLLFCHKPEKSLCSNWFLCFGHAHLDNLPTLKPTIL